MSAPLRSGFNLNSAAQFNTVNAILIEWYGSIPENAQEDYPGLAGDPVIGDAMEQAEFAKAVYQFQKESGLQDHELDGKLGRQTWSRLLKTYDFIEDTNDFVVRNGRRLAISLPTSKLVSFDEQGGLDLHRWGRFYRAVLSKKKPRLVTVHWGGVDPKHLYRVFSNPKGWSSHFGCGQGVGYQMIDLMHGTYHGGYVNKLSIGLDICQQPGAEWYEKMLKKGYKVEKVRNTVGRGPKKVLTLDPQIARTTREFVLALCKLYDIPLRAPRGKDGMAMEGDLFHGVMSPAKIKSGEFTGVLGHHHVSKKKWDCAIWWDAVFAGTPLG